MDHVLRWLPPLVFLGQSPECIGLRDGGELARPRIHSQHLENVTMFRCWTHRWWLMVIELVVVDAKHCCCCCQIEIDEVRYCRTAVSFSHHLQQRFDKWWSEFFVLFTLLLFLLICCWLVFALEKPIISRRMIPWWTLAVAKQSPGEIDTKLGLVVWDQFEN